MTGPSGDRVGECTGPRAGPVRSDPGKNGPPVSDELGPSPQTIRVLSLDFNLLVMTRFKIKAAIFAILSGAGFCRDS